MKEFIYHMHRDALEIILQAHKCMSRKDIKIFLHFPQRYFSFHQHLTQQRVWMSSIMQTNVKLACYDQSALMWSWCRDYSMLSHLQCVLSKVKVRNLKSVTIPWIRSMNNSVHQLNWRCKLFKSNYTNSNVLPRTRDCLI